MTLLASDTIELSCTVYAENGDVYATCFTCPGAVCNRASRSRMALLNQYKLSTLTLHTLQAPSSRHFQAVRAPILAAGGLSPVSSSRSAYAGIATFRNGSSLRSAVASGSWLSKPSRRPLSVSSAAATDVQEETHEYQAEVLCTTFHTLMLSQHMHQTWELTLQISDAHKANADLSSGVTHGGRPQLYACRCIE